MSVAKVLIADLPIPSPGYGSWSQRMEYLVQEYSGNVFDYLICHPSHTRLKESRTRRIVCQVDKNRIMNRVFIWWRFRRYKKALAEIHRKHGSMIIGVLDSLRTQVAVKKFIDQLGISETTRLVYYQCGFATYLTADKYERFTNGLHHLIYLTENAYRYELKHNPSLPFVAHVLPNPIDHRKCYIPNDNERNALRKKFGMEDGIHFIWASQDRPKKGLAVVLMAWSRFYAAHKHLKITLHVVGVAEKKPVEGVRFYGRVANYETHAFFKAADIGVFSSVWTEGFSLSLAEQISCGLFCIASTAGCVEDFFIPGKHGIAIDMPNFPEKWEKAFGSALLQIHDFRSGLEKQITPPFLTYDEWCAKFCSIFTEIAETELGNAQSS